mmetsp:Transcript_17941/g.63381  ORF Transcript_17941/g.63381 Transcript_17941/m.63381 type:complete len:232 (+) Transcript_17941:1077-1772(+)
MEGRGDGRRYGGHADGDPRHRRDGCGAAAHREAAAVGAQAARAKDARVRRPPQRLRGHCRRHGRHHRGAVELDHDVDADAARRRRRTDAGAGLPAHAGRQHRHDVHGAARLVGGRHAPGAANRALPPHLQRGRRAGVLPAPAHARNPAGDGARPGSGRGALLLVPARVHAGGLLHRAALAARHLVAVRRGCGRARRRRLPHRGDHPRRRRPHRLVLQVRRQGRRGRAAAEA